MVNWRSALIEIGCFPLLLLPPSVQEPGYMEPVWTPKFVTVTDTVTGKSTSHIFEGSTTLDTDNPTSEEVPAQVRAALTPPHTPPVAAVLKFRAGNLRCLTPLVNSNIAITGESDQ